MLSCKLFQEESQRTTQQGFYAMEPETLLEALKQKDANAFVTIMEQDIDYSAPISPSVNWTQSDYFQIVDAFHNLVLNDELEDWHLDSMSFALNCDDVNVGFQDGRFEFHQIVKDENNQEVRLSRFIDIDPRYKAILLWEREFSPYIIQRSVIDLSSIKYDSEKILQIAEDSGGRNQRLHLDNACSITLGLWPDTAQYRGWKVTYIRDDSNLPAFEIDIDPATGNIER